MYHHFFLCFLSFLVYCTSSLHAQEIRGIEAKAIGTHFFHAQNNAIFSAERKAFTQLMQKKDPFFSIPPALSQNVIISMISTYKIYDEKPGPHFYEAHLDITFDPKKVEAFLSSSQKENVPIAYLQEKKEDICILPTSFKEQNLWFEAWNATHIHLHSFFPNIIISPASPTHKDALRCMVAQIDNTPPQSYRMHFNEKTLFFPHRPGENTRETYQRIAHFLLMHFLPFPTNQSLLSKAMEWEIFFSDTKEWTQIQDVLHHFPYLFHWKINKVEPHSAQITLITSGDIQQLSSLFSPYHMVFTFKGNQACLYPRTLPQNPCP